MRLIDADAFHKYVDDKLEKGEGAFTYGVPYEWAWTLTAVDCAPTIDAVEVVRCKDCKFKEDCMKQIEHWGRDHVLEQNIYEYKKIDFCSYGERKEE